MGDLNFINHLEFLDSILMAKPEEISETSKNPSNDGSQKDSFLI